MSKKCVVLLSGGLDSTVLLYTRLELGYDCYPLAILYGQRHEKEVLSAAVICKLLSLDLKRIDLSVLKELLPSSLTGIGDVPDGHYADESMKSTVVPNRNMILLSVAAGYAQGIGSGFVAYAAHKGDHPIYPDCRPVFVESARETITLGTGWSHDGVQLLAPFIRYTKADIVKLGETLGVPFELTWSCYKGGDIHCGVCGTCTERKEAFVVAKVKDRTVYKE